jgi:hypothetical protein
VYVPATPLARWLAFGHFGEHDGRAVGKLGNDAHIAAHCFNGFP